MFCLLKTGLSQMTYLLGRGDQVYFKGQVEIGRYHDRRQGRQVKKADQLSTYL
jgi:hypothetical protein